MGSVRFPVEGAALGLGHLRLALQYSSGRRHGKELRHHGLSCQAREWLVGKGLWDEGSSGLAGPFCPPSSLPLAGRGPGCHVQDRLHHRLNALPAPGQEQVSSVTSTCISGQEAADTGPIKPAKHLHKTQPF